MANNNVGMNDMKMAFHYCTILVVSLSELAGFCGANYKAPGMNTAMFCCTQSCSLLARFISTRDRTLWALWVSFHFNRQAYSLLCNLFLSSLHKIEWNLYCWFSRGFLFYFGGFVPSIVVGPHCYLPKALIIKFPSALLWSHPIVQFMCNLIATLFVLCLHKWITSLHPSQYNVLRKFIASWCRIRRSSRAPDKFIRDLVSNWMRHVAWR